MSTLSRQHALALAAAALSLAATLALAAERAVLTTDFSDAAVGSDMSKLDKPVLSNWTGMGASIQEPASALIVDRGSPDQPNPALQLAKGAGIFRAVDLAPANGGKMIVIRFRFTDTPDDDWFGVFLRDGSNVSPYRLQTNPGLNGGKGALILRKDRTQLFSKTISLTGTHELELRITCTTPKNTIAILLDGELIGSGEDSGQDATPVLTPTDHANISFSNFNNEDTAKTIVDDISVKIRTVSDADEPKDAPSP
ncbi:MAG: hypothetical protein ACYC26_15105 [Phycisphaerales bacterium]